MHTDKRIRWPPLSCAGIFVHVCYRDRERAFNFRTSCEANYKLCTSSSAYIYKLITSCGPRDDVRPSAQAQVTGIQCSHQTLRFLWATLSTIQCGIHYYVATVHNSNNSLFQLYILKISIADYRVGEVKKQNKKTFVKSTAWWHGPSHHQASFGVCTVIYQTVPVIVKYFLQIIEFKLCIDPKFLE